MSQKELISPIHQIVFRARLRRIPFIAIGDGGNELGMVRKVKG